MWKITSKNKIFYKIISIEKFYSIVKIINASTIDYKKVYFNLLYLSQIEKSKDKLKKVYSMNF